jgi:hypothetical protein
MSIATVTLHGKPVRYFSSRFIRMGGREFEIISTASTGRGVYDAVDVVKNDRGEYKEFKRIDLLNLVEK